MSTPLEAVTGTVAYLTVCFIGIPCITAYNIISSIFRGIGDSKSPMYFIAIACVVNIGLDICLLGYLHLGPVGAAAWYYFVAACECGHCTDRDHEKRKPGISLSRKDFRPDHRL